MNVLVIGADRPWGALLAAGLGAGFEVVAIGSEVDLLERESVDPVLAGVEAVVYAAASDLSAVPAQADPIGDSEQVLLDEAARGTYVALMAACAAGVEKVVLLSCLDLVRDYPEEYIVDPRWNAIPRAEAESLAPLMAELVGREIARTGQIEVRCLRLGALGEETMAEDAVAAVRDALTAEREGHHWSLAHVASSGRFA